MCVDQNDTCLTYTHCNLQLLTVHTFNKLVHAGSPPASPENKRGGHLSVGVSRAGPRSHTLCTY